MTRAEKLNEVGCSTPFFSIFFGRMGKHMLRNAFRDLNIWKDGRYPNFEDSLMRPVILEGELKC